MILRSIKLSNIRSYSSQKIDFPRGSLLLSGDVGSGKSTILLSIEFALFGTIGTGSKRGSMLLKNGKKNGYVELEFEVEGKHAIVRRTLERTKSSVAQKAGHLIVNGVKTDLVATELKARILKMLGYPEGLLARKFSIYPYTVYTPQEEMKKILFDDSNHRTETLRKIFGMDRYGAIKKNAEVVSRSIKNKTLEISARTGNLEGKKTELKEISENQKRLSLEKDSLVSELRKVEEKIFEEKEKRTKIESSLEELRESKTKLASIQSSLREKERSIVNLKMEIKKLVEDVLVCEKALNSFAETEFQANLACLNHHLSLLESEKGSESEEELNVKIRTMREHVRSAADKIIRARTTREEAIKLEKNVLGSDVCPVCRQNIEESHKNQFRNQISSDLEDASKIIEEKTVHKKILESQLERCEKNLKSFLDKEKDVSDFKFKYNHYLEQAKKHGVSSTAYDGRPCNLKEVMSLLERAVNHLEQKPMRLEIIAQKKEQENSYKKKLAETEFEIEELRSQEASIKSELEQFSNVEKDVSVLEKSIKNLNDQKLNLSTAEARLSADLSNLQKNRDRVQKEIAEIEKDKLLLEKYSQYKNWIDDHLIPLSEEVEKAVMLKVHEQLNDLFQEWFRVLMEEESISAKLDESFAPFVEISGYDIPLENLSGGEKNGCALAYRLALNKVINLSVPKIKTHDLLILDEPTDGFSSQQLEKMRDVLSQLDLPQIIIVSHEQKVESFVENVIKIGKHQGESYLLES